MFPVHDLLVGQHMQGLCNKRLQPLPARLLHDLIFRSHLL